MQHFDAKIHFISWIPKIGFILELQTQQDYEHNKNNALIVMYAQLGSYTLVPKFPL